MAIRYYFQIPPFSFRNERLQWLDIVATFLQVHYLLSHQTFLRRGAHCVRFCNQLKSIIPAPLLVFAGIVSSTSSLGAIWELFRRAFCHTVCQNRCAALPCLAAAKQLPPAAVFTLSTAFVFHSVGDGHLCGVNFLEESCGCPI